MTTVFDESSDGFQAVRFDGKRLELIDQRLLPQEERWLRIDQIDAVIAAIADLVVRGAPAIGVTAAYGAVMAARARGDDLRGWLTDMQRLEQARPTAVNLAWAVARMREVTVRLGRLDSDALADEAYRMHRADIEANRTMAKAGSAVIDPGSGVLTHCNTGSLATGGIGTALGVVLEGVRSGRVERVYADETRPWLQGSRLTAWELARAGVEFQVLVEGAAAALMASGKVDWVITGADRIAANGDVANKIGTYALAVLARHHGVKMMVVAPSSTVDPAMASGQGIEIEQRDSAEIWRAAGIESVPSGFAAWNPVFDITPAELVDCIVTENGVFYPDYDFSQP
ncbi:S-methyl-5-thioribose-1-phosphate isomerase [Wenzhouxiangella limi]|uniref:Methylthioribose-1-phosphate isomerase n=1 Tax=Wenzhouxiangella limi TaxID=2707351 RepID=A0A845UTL4_9GAMM|nr:S-methyl-5-thioribose-1-phosphate isomerase [Wenzhouxiangella limi]NDY94867.1 S-methyl-5-thioribose-1-phosphate isomerase [Wenzhouxiangella limi]